MISIIQICWFFKIFVVSIRFVAAIDNRCSLVSTNVEYVVLILEIIIIYFFKVSHISSTYHLPGCPSSFTRSFQRSLSIISVLSSGTLYTPVSSSRLSMNFRFLLPSSSVSGSTLMIPTEQYHSLLLRYDVHNDLQVSFSSFLFSLLFSNNRKQTR